MQSSTFFKLLCFEFMERRLLTNKWSDSHVLARFCSQELIPNHYVLWLLCSPVPFFNHCVLNTWGDGCSPINEVTTHFPYFLPPSVKKSFVTICEKLASFQTKLYARYSEKSLIIAIFHFYQLTVSNNVKWKKLYDCLYIEISVNCFVYFCLNPFRHHFPRNNPRLLQREVTAVWV